MLKSQYFWAQILFFLNSVSIVMDNYDMQEYLKIWLMLLFKLLFILRFIKIIYIFYFLKIIFNFDLKIKNNNFYQKHNLKRVKSRISFSKKESR